MSFNPQLTVILPVYNGERYLKEAMASILNQTFSDFKLLVIDDGSVDDSYSIAKSFADPRVQIIRNAKNLGLITSLNRGLAEAQTEFIARMDSDDVSLPERFQEQLNLFKENPAIAICGTWIKPLGENPQLKKWYYFSKPDLLKCQMLFSTPLAHPTVMFKRAVFEKIGGYDPNFKHAEDYEFWVRASNDFLFSNVKKRLLIFRSHSNQISKRFNLEQQASVEKIRKNQIKLLGLNPNKKNLEIHRLINSGSIIPSFHFLQKAIMWLYQLKLANLKKRIFPEPSFSTMLQGKQRDIFEAYEKLSFQEKTKYSGYNLLQKFLQKSA